MEKDNIMQIVMKCNQCFNIDECELDLYGGDIRALANKLTKEIMEGFTIEVLYSGLLEEIFDIYSEINIFIHNGRIFINKQIG